VLCLLDTGASQNFITPKNIESDALPSPLLDPKGVQLCQIVEVVWDLEPLPASSTKGGKRGVLKALGLD
jgi:hypothetical protein